MAERKTVTRKLARVAKILIVVGAFTGSVLAQPQGEARFEVASIRQQQGNVFRSGPLTVADPLIRLTGYTIFGVVMDAYHVRDFQLKISPDIPKDDVLNKMYNIVARAPGGGTPRVEDVRIMLQNLLADRFQLKVHREEQEMQVYLLQVAKSGLKLQVSSGSGPCSVRTGLAADGRNDEEVFSNCPMERLADRLKDKIGNRPILDKTGLTGMYNMRLVAAPEARTRRGADPADIDPRTAVREMGLTLTPAKEFVEIIAVDHLERLTEN